MVVFHLVHHHTYPVRFPVDYQASWNWRLYCVKAVPMLSHYGATSTKLDTLLSSWLRFRFGTRTIWKNENLYNELVHVLGCSKANNRLNILIIHQHFDHLLILFSLTPSFLDIQLLP